jgi:hypothetical protein
MSRAMSADLASRLQADSEEIDRALGDYLKQRAEVNDKHTEARLRYEQEMADIGDISDTEEDGLFDENPSMTQSAVEPNIGRLAKIRGATPVGTADSTSDFYDDEENFEDFYGDGDDLDYTQRPGNFSQDLGKKKKKKGVLSKEIQIRRTVPSNTVKIDMREAFFEKLSFGRMDEAQYEEHLEKCKAEANDDLETKRVEIELAMHAATTPEELDNLQDQLDTLIPDQRLTDEVTRAADSLFDFLDDRNDYLNEFIKDYQPRTSGKAWGGDPDYFKMLKKMKKRLQVAEVREAGSWLNKR